jgi:hypothetical protein
METVQAAAQAKTVKALQAMIVGRIDIVRPFEANGKKVYEHRVVTPAADAYSSPMAFMVQSSMKLGNAGDDVRTMVEIIGWKDKFTKRDGEEVQTARMMLRAID